jgi:hypothetical protein
LVAQDAKPLSYYSRSVEVDQALREGHLYAFGGEVDFAEVAFGEGDEDFIV